MMRLAAAGLILATNLLPAAPAVAQFNGTLFSSPDEREYLDFLREQYIARQQQTGFNIVEQAIPEIPQEATDDAPPPPRPFTLAGIAERRDGGHTIWLNGRALSEGDLDRGVALAREDGVLGLRFSTAGGSYFIKPGQTIELNSGTIQESYQRSPASPAAVAAQEEAGNTQQAAQPAAPATPEAETDTPADQAAADGNESINFTTLEELQALMQQIEESESQQ